jgi:putative flippase GtrA
LIIYLFAYMFDYYLTLKFVFNKEHKSPALIRYVLYLVSFYVLNNLLFNGFLWLNINHLIASMFVIAILFPLRFFVNKFLVFA